jgi:hypothetical protein
MSEQLRRQHTPGPWEIYDQPTGYEIYGHIDAERSMSTHVCTVAESDQDRANANVIGASPDLLDACKGLLGLLQLICARDDVPQSLAADINANHRAIEARAAIAKAEGLT